MATIYSDIKNLLEKASIIEYASATVMYLGFPAIGNPDTDQNEWAVCKVTKSTADEDTYPRTISLKWANGSRLPRVTWDDRATHEYFYEK